VISSSSPGVNIDQRKIVCRSTDLSYTKQNHWKIRHLSWLLSFARWRHFVVQSRFK